MPSEEDRRIIVDAFDNDCLWPAGDPRLEDAWLGIYQLLLWYDHGYIHIRESNDLKNNRKWQEKAKAAESYIASSMGISVDELPSHVDKMMQLPRWAEPLADKGTLVSCPHCNNEFLVPAQGQRQNPLGNGLRILTAEILRRWGDPRFTYEEEALAANRFPGIQMPGRSANPKVDVLAGSAAGPCAIVSCKWSGRHDRMSDITNECQEYKAAAVRRQNMNLKHYVVTNELDGQRTDKVLNQPCIDGLVMVHLPLAKEMGTITPLMERNIETGRLLDLTTFVELSKGWPP